MSPIRTLLLFSLIVLLVILTKKNKRQKVKKRKKPYVKKVIKYVPETKTFHQGFSLSLLKRTFSCHYVIAERKVYFSGKKIGFSKYKRKNKLGFGFSVFERSLLFVLKK